jgi:RNA recognition motif-containing protein
MDRQQFRPPITQSRPDQDASAGSKIYITGIQPKTSKEQLGSCFAACGLIKDCFVMSDKGYGFITFESPEAAAQAVKMSGRNFGSVVPLALIFTIKWKSD